MNNLSGWRDLNPRSSGPKPDALAPRLHPVLRITGNWNTAYTQLLSKSCNFTENKVSCQAEVRANTSDIFAYGPAELLRLTFENMHTVYSVIAQK